MAAETELIVEVLEDPDCGFRARAVGAGIFTFAESLELLKENIREAVNAFYDDEDGRPEAIKLQLNSRV